MITRLRQVDVGPFSISGTAAAAFLLLLAFPATAASTDAEAVSSTLPAVEKRLVAIRKTADPEIMLAENEQKPIDAAADEGFGSFISLNAGEELLAEIHFDSGSTQPTYIGKRKIEHVLKDLKALNPKQLRIVGFTDRTGSDAVNKAISEARAESVAAMRAAEVADAIRNDPRYRDVLSVVEYGEAKPAIDTGDGVVESLNRRVLITIVPDELDLMFLA